MKDYKYYDAADNCSETTINVCSITNKPYMGYGNNAWPFKGRCSDEANMKYVIPSRFLLMKTERDGNTFMYKQLYKTFQSNASLGMSLIDSVTRRS